MTFQKFTRTASRRLRAGLIGLTLALVWAAPAAGQDPVPTTINVSGGSSGATQRLPAGQLEFGLRVPLRGNSENVLTVVAADELGRQATSAPISVGQITLTEIVRARVTSQRLQPEEVRALVADGTIKLSDPANFNVSRFVIALTVGTTQVELPMTVAREKEMPFGKGESVSIGCAAPGKGLSTTERSIAIPCGGGGGGKQPPITIIPFELAVPGLPTEPGIPGVILIEGRIKTLKEFYRVTLLLQNLSGIFDLKDITARLELPDGALTAIAPASGTTSIDDLGPGAEGTGQFIVRGDEIGLHTVTAHFGATLVGPFLPQPVPISGSASTDVEVKGPPKMAVKVSHPDYVIANEPYDLEIEITNTDTELDALYTSLALDIGADARLIDPETGEPLVGPVDRSLGDILRGESVKQTYRVLPLVTGAITSCTAAASQNLQLTMAFIGPNQPGCAIGTLPADRVSPDGKPTVTVLPAHNTVDVAPVAPIVAIFSAMMLPTTITTGYPEATFKLLDPAGNVVPASIKFATLFEATAAYIQPVSPMALASEYTIVVEEAIFSEDGLSLSSGMTARFSTKGAVPAPDTTAPSVSLAVQPPLLATAIPLGELVPVLVTASDNVGVRRVDLYLNDELVDAKESTAALKFLVDSSGLDPAESHVVRALVTDLAGNQMAATLILQLAGDVTPPSLTGDMAATVLQGRVAQVTIAATDEGRVDRVSAYLDADPVPVFRSLVAPYDFSMTTRGLADGPHRLQIVALDGAGNERSIELSFQVVADHEPPAIVLRTPEPGFRLRPDGFMAISANAVDNVEVAALHYFVDDELLPREAGQSGFLLNATGLAVGPHVLRLRAFDTAGNTALLEAPFEVFEPASDLVPPPPPDAALIFATTPQNGAATISGLAGAVEGRATVLVINAAEEGDAQVLAASDGSFATEIEASGGQTIVLIAVDEAGNRSLPTTISLPAPVTLVSMTVTPPAITLNRATTSQQISIVGHYSDGTQQALTAGITYASSAATVAKVLGSGLVLPGQNGSATVTVSAAALGLPPVDVPVTVDFSTILGITASPNPMTIAGLGQSRELTLSAQYSDNTSGPFSGTARYGTANAAVAIVDGNGRVTSTGIGSTNITVISGDLPPATVLVVVEPVTAVDLLVSPNTLGFTAIDQVETLTPRFRFSDDTIGSGPFAVTYESLNESVATVSGAGVVTAAGEGNTAILVRSLTFTVNVPVAVTLPTTLPPPEIASLGRPIAGRGDTVAVLGRNFAATPAHNFVTINGVAAQVIGAASDRLLVLVPHGAATGPVLVRVAGQDSNTVDLSIYARRAAAVLTGAPFDASPALAGEIVDLGSAEFYVHPGDRVVVSGDPNTINGPTWLALVGPGVQGTLTVTINDVEHTFHNPADVVTLTNLMPSSAEPMLVTIGARIEASGGFLSSRGVAIVAGPPDTGVFVGERFTTGDGIAQQTVLRFRVNAADGTKFAATAGAWYRLSDGGWNNGSAGGTMTGGEPTPNDGGFRTYTALNGEVAVTYSDAAVVSTLGESQTVVVALLPATAAGHRVGNTPVAEARLLVGALDSASVLPQQTSTIADGVDRPIVVDINSVRDHYGNRVTDGTRLAVTADAWYRRSDGGYHNNSAGGDMTGGSPTPNDANFRTYELVNGAAQAVYTALPVIIPSADMRTTVLAAVPAGATGSRLVNRPFGEGTIKLSSATGGTATVNVLPATLAATTSDNRSVITVSGLTDSAGRPVPDGTRIAVTADTWYRASDGGWHNGSFGGSIVGGDAVANDGRFRSFVVTGGQVTFTYSNAGLVLNRSETATTVIALLPARGNGDRIGTRPFAEASIVQGGVTSASIVATPASTLADGTRRPIAVAVTNIRDALGNPVPEGTRISLTADPWYRREDGGYHNGSAGGVFIDGVATPNDGRFRTYTVLNGRVDATFSAETIAPLASKTPKSSVIAATAASATNNHRMVNTPFAEGVVAVSGLETATVTASPASLLADKQARTSTITLTGLVDGQGVPVPDGTQVAITATQWYRLADGGWHNGSAGGTMLGGMATPNDGRFRTYTVVNGAVTATYSSHGLFAEPGDTAPVIVSVLPATPAGNVIGSRPFAIGTVTLASLDSGTFTAPATTTPGGNVAVTLTNIRDAVGNLVPDGTRIAVTASQWYNRNGSWHNGSAGGAISGGVPTPNDGRFRTFVVTGGEITFTFTAPASANVTSVISAISADGADNINTNRPFTVVAIRVQ